MSKKISDEEFLERFNSVDWSSSKLKWAEPDKIDLVIEKLDKIIELLTPKEVIVSSPISVTSSNEHSLQANNINEALLKLAKGLGTNIV